MEQAILDEVFGGTAYAAEASVQVGLLTTLPSDDTGTGLVEASYTGYSRQTLTNNATNWPAATGGDPTIKDNGVAISFGQKTDAGDITVVGFAIWEADGTTLMFFGDVTPNATVSQNDTPEFAIGDLDLKLGDPGDTY
jgi:hypothetical protein